MDLPKVIELSGEWVVGLCEIIYPDTWYNLSLHLAYFELNKTTEDPSVEASYNGVTTCIDFKGNSQHKIKRSVTASHHCSGVYGSVGRAVAQ